MSQDTPDIVLNEFGDLSRKARRELEARGIDPDTAVIEYIAATGQMPVITPEEAAAAKAQAQVDAAYSREVSEPPAQVEASSSVVEIVAEVPVIQQPAQELSVEPLVPPVSVPVTSAETGPIEPLVTAPALDSGSLSAVQETLAAVTEQSTVELSSDAEDVAAGDVTMSNQPVKRLSRREKRQQARSLREELKAAQQIEEIITGPSEIVETPEEPSNVVAEETSVVAAPVAEDENVIVAPAEDVQAEPIVEQDVDVIDLVSDVAEETSQDVPVDVSQAEIPDAEDFEPLPQTISEATAAIAIAEAVAAAEAVVSAGELNTDEDSRASAVPATTGSISIVTNALILPSLPETTGSIAPILPTEEIVITGSILIPSAVSQTGTLNTLDTSEIDVISDDEPDVKTSGMAPVSAASAVSAYNISNTVVTAPRGLNERLPFILSVTAAGLAVGVVALFVAGYFLGLF